MITVRPASARGNANFGWLDRKHSFSFGSYYDPNHMGFASLRAINEEKQEKLGLVEVNSQVLNSGDGAAITDKTEIAISSTTDRTKILLLDLA